MKFLKTTAIAIIGLALFATSAMADLTIYTGTKGGGYDSMAKSISARLSQRGIVATVENRAGSDDITLQACNNPNSVWIAQGDALYKREFKDGCYLSVLADYGDEYAMIFFPPGSDKKNLDDLSAENKIFVAKVGSGSELTAKNMQAIEKEHGKGDDWSNAAMETGDLRRLNALASRGKVDAAILVMAPSDDRIAKLLDTGWKLGYLYDKDINDLMFGQKPLYEAEKVTITTTGGKQKNWAYKVSSFIGTTEAIETDNPDTFDALLSAFE